MAIGIITNSIKIRQYNFEFTTDGDGRGIIGVPYTNKCLSVVAENAICIGFRKPANSDARH